MKYRAERRIGKDEASIGPERDNREDARSDMNQYVGAMKTGTPAFYTLHPLDCEWITFTHGVHIIHAFVTTIIE